MIRGISSPPLPMIHRHHYALSYQPSNPRRPLRTVPTTGKLAGMTVYGLLRLQLVVWCCPHSHGDICT